MVVVIVVVVLVVVVVLIIKLIKVHAAGDELIDFIYICEVITQKSGVNELREMIAAKTLAVYENMTDLLETNLKEWED